MTSVAIPGVHYAQALSLPADESSVFAQAGRAGAVRLRCTPTNANLTLGQTERRRPADDPPLQCSRHRDGEHARAGHADARSGAFGAVPSVSSRRPSHGLFHARPVAALRRQQSRDQLRTAVDRRAGRHHPSLTFHWSGARTVSSIDLTPSSHAARPLQVKISSPSGHAVEPVPPARWRHHVPGDDHRQPDGPIREGGAADRPRARRPRPGSYFPVGVAGLRIPALGHVAATARQPRGRPAVRQWADRAGSMVAHSRRRCVGQCPTSRTSNPWASRSAALSRSPQATTSFGRGA